MLQDIAAGKTSRWKKVIGSECLSPTMHQSSFCCEAGNYFVVMIAGLVGICEIGGRVRGRINGSRPDHICFRRTADNCRLREARQIIEKAQSIFLAPPVLLVARSCSLLIGFGRNFWLSMDVTRDGRPSVSRGLDAQYPRILRL